MKAINGELDKLHTVKEAAEILHVHPLTVYRRIWSGHIRQVKLGAKIVRVPSSELTRITQGL